EQDRNDLVGAVIRSKRLRVVKKRQNGEEGRRRRGDDRFFFGEEKRGPEDQQEIEGVIPAGSPAAEEDEGGDVKEGDEGGRVKRPVRAAAPVGKEEEEPGAEGEEADAVEDGPVGRVGLRENMKGQQDDPGRQKIKKAGRFCHDHLLFFGLLRQELL